MFRRSSRPFKLIAVCAVILVCIYYLYSNNEDGGRTNRKTSILNQRQKTQPYQNQNKLGMHGREREGPLIEAPEDMIYKSSGKRNTKLNDVNLFQDNEMLDINENELNKIENNNIAMDRSLSDDEKVEVKKKHYPMALDMIGDQLEEIKHLQELILKNQKRLEDQTYKCNVTASDLIPMDRAIPDTRPDICATIEYDLSLYPRVSVVIPFYNEALSMLMRTVYSLLKRTPDVLLAEIILVDDRSTHEALQVIYRF